MMCDQKDNRNHNPENHEETESFRSTLADHPLVAVLRAETAEDAIEKADALIEAGITCIEVTFTVPNAGDVIQYLVKRKGCHVGAGTVVTAQQVQEAITAGARFLVSPGYSFDVDMAAKDANVPYIPGVLTPTDIMAALAQGHRLMKLFPANVLGPGYLRGLREPFPQVSFMPTGGISIADMNDWFAAGAVAVGMGGALTKGTADQVKCKAQEALAQLQR
ncbi:ketohydroxyglutarate aldolase [Collibacillus ludicampi]|uniref:Ketohydroxyglutarate aldolase n=2 Tax=Collibacillus ludicampi TaxID=2771369 RepID=A0AAV4LAZ9_9BACL|nr:ketohydroxyglutarate aldolase [Collibacillus ludicampi]